MVMQKCAEKGLGTESQCASPEVELSNPPKCSKSNIQVSNTWRRCCSCVWVQAELERRRRVTQKCAEKGLGTESQWRRRKSNFRTHLSVRNRIYRCQIHGGGAAAVS